MKPIADATPKFFTAAIVGSAIGTMIHALIWLALLVGLVAVVPRYDRIFVDFDTELPVMTHSALSLSRGAVNYWYLLAVFNVIALALDVIAFLMLAHIGGHIAQVLWGILWFIVPLIVAAWITLAIWLPLNRLMHELTLQPVTVADNIPT